MQQRGLRIFATLAKILQNLCENLVKFSKGCEIPAKFRRLRNPEKFRNPCKIYWVFGKFAAVRLWTCTTFSASEK